MRNRTIQMGILCALASFAAPAWAAPYLSPDDKLPSLDLTADSSSVVLYDNGILMRHLHLSNPSNQVPAGSGNFNIDSFFDVFVELSLDNGNSWNPYQAPGHTTIHVGPAQPSGPQNIYDTEMLALDISGGTLPPGVMFRDSPITTMPSTGTTVIEPAGGGYYHIDSFFDVFTELSLDGGQNWKLGVSNEPGGGLHLTGTPEPATAVLLAAGGLLLYRRRRTA